MTAGDIYTIAGGGNERGSGHLATSDWLPRPQGVAVDRFGNVLVTTTHSGQNLLDVVAVRSGTFYGRQMTALHLYTIAGGGSGIVPGNRLATRIWLPAPEGVAIEPSGDVLVDETGGNR